MFSLFKSFRPAIRGYRQGREMTDQQVSHDGVVCSVELFNHWPSLFFLSRRATRLLLRWKGSWKPFSDPFFFGRLLFDFYFLLLSPFRYSGSDIWIGRYSQPVNIFAPSLSLSILLPQLCLCLNLNGRAVFFSSYSFKKWRWRRRRGEPFSGLFSCTAAGESERGNTSRCGW